MFGKNIGIDLGTSSVLIYVRGKGIALREPTVVAMEKPTGRIIKMGFEAQEMLGKTPKNIFASKPLKEGVICDYDTTEKMLRYFIKKACPNTLFRPNAVISVPPLINEVEERAVRQAAINAGAKNIELIESPMAAAIGSGLDITRPRGTMVVDIGGGTTDIAVMSLGDVVVSVSYTHLADRTKKSVWTYTRTVNMELSAISDAYMQYKNLGAYTYEAGDVPEYTQFENNYEGFDALNIISSNETLLVGCFDKKEGNGKAFTVVNMSEVSLGKIADVEFAVPNAEKVTAYIKGIPTVLREDVYKRQFLMF